MSHKINDIWFETIDEIRKESGMSTFSSAKEAIGPYPTAEEMNDYPETEKVINNDDDK